MLKTPKRLRQSESHGRSKQQEKELAARFKGRTTANSGAGYKKADVHADLVIIEAKTTKNKSFSITSKMIDKLESDTLGSDKIPVIAVELELGKKKVYVIPDWAIELVLGMKNAIE